MYLGGSRQVGTRKVLMRFSGGPQRLDGVCKGFNEELWTALIEHVTIYTKDDIRFIFQDRYRRESYQIGKIV